MKKSTKLFDTFRAIGIALFIALVLRQFVIAAYKIPSGSMEETLQVGDFLLVNKFVYGAEVPEWIGIPFTRGKDWYVPTGFETPSWIRYRFPPLDTPKSNDIFVFRFPRNPKLEYIKRCIAVEHQSVEILNKTVYVDGRQMVEPEGLKTSSDIRTREEKSYELFQPELGSRDNFGPLLVAANSYFVLGDNRDKSEDSRNWGFVPEQNIVGKPLITYLSLETDPTGEKTFGRIRWERLGRVVR
ncbi:MAG: signal peptidase I [Calditrichia bacterium]